MNSILVEDVRPWTNSKKQTKEPVRVEINIINVSKVIGCIIGFYRIIEPLHALSLADRCV